jgi:hypothetical protein
MPAEHDHLQMAMGRFEPGYQLPAVPAWQRPVNHGDMEVLLPCGVKCLVWTNYADDAHSTASETTDEDFQELLVVIDQQNRAVRHHFIAYRGNRFEPGATTSILSTRATTASRSATRAHASWRK